MAHTKVGHLGARDFVCDAPACGKAYGYKHLLQRHVLKAHGEHSSSAEDDDEESSSSATEPEAGPSMSVIDFITGKHYLESKRGRALVRCPYPAHFCRSVLSDAGACRFVFSRAYDLRRHLRAEHGEEWEKDDVDAWVRQSKKESAAT